MTKKPRTTPIQPLRGTAPVHVSPTLRPTSDAGLAGEGDWIRLPEAVDLLAPHNETRTLAFQGLWRRVLLGLIPVTCEALIYERIDGRRERQTFTWPGPPARLAEQMLAANGKPLAGYRIDVGNSEAQWSDVTGAYSVNAIAIGLRVDRVAVAMMHTPTTKRAASAPEPMTQGRPMLVHKVMPEFERRIASGEVHLSVAAEARALAAWYCATYPPADGNKNLTPKAIEPYIRGRINGLKTAGNGA